MKFGSCLKPPLIIGSSFFNRCCARRSRLLTVFADTPKKRAYLCTRHLSEVMQRHDSAFTFPKLRKQFLDNIALCLCGDPFVFRKHILRVSRFFQAVQRPYPSATAYVNAFYVTMCCSGSLQSHKANWQNAEVS